MTPNPKPPILIVDDEKNILDALFRLLREDFSVKTVVSPFDALKEIQHTVFHVILSDQRMPEMTGVDLFEKVKHICPQAVRVLLTGYTDIESVIGAINRGHVYRYVAKPWDPNELKAVVRQAAEYFQLRTDLEQKNTQLNEAYAALKKLDHARGKFLRLVSHELNTPLTLVSSFTALLQEHAGELKADSKRALAGLKGAVDRFGEIISDVLSFVTIASRDGNPRDGSWVEVDLDSLVAEALERNKQAIQNKALRCIHKKSVLLVRTRPDPIALAVSKLVEDTIRRAPHGSEIAFKVETTSLEKCLTATRNGDPLPPKAFEILETDSNEMTYQSGLGLALPLCKLSVENGGGAIRTSAVFGNVSVTLAFPGA